MGFLSIIFIGFLAGVVAKLLLHAVNEAPGFILTAILGIIGSLVASYLGEALGWYKPGEDAQLIGAVSGATYVLLLYNMFKWRGTHLRG